MEVLLNRYSVL